MGEHANLCVDNGKAYVWLNVYDLGTMSKWLLNSWVPGTIGAFHCGVEVMEMEWCFQAVLNSEDETLTGVACHEARQHPRHHYRCSVPLGAMTLSANQFYAIMLALTREWLASGYHFVQRNCVDFAEALLSQLGVTEPF